MATTYTIKPSTTVASILSLFILSLLTSTLRFSISRMYTSLMIEEEEESKSEETVDTVAAIGPIMVMPAQKGPMVFTIVSGVILSTLFPYAAKVSVKIPLESTPIQVATSVMAPMVIVPISMALCSALVFL